MSQLCDLPENSIVTFPEGVPGFEDSQRFVLVKPRKFAPVFLLQDVDEEALSLPVIPVQFVDRDYRLKVEGSDRELLEMGEEPVLGTNVLCLLVLILPSSESPPTCNLFAPIVINPASMRGKQILQIGSEYPTIFPLAAD